MSAEYDPAEIYVQTTFKQRTIDSATSQLDGLYGKTLLWPTDDYAMNTIPKFDDYIMHVVNNNCPRLKGMLKDTRYNTASKVMYEQIDADLEATLFPELRELTNMLDTGTKEMHNVCNYIYWANESWHGSVPLKFELTEQQYKQCLVSKYRKDYYEFDAS